jgi:hypothetical protein
MLRCRVSSETVCVRPAIIEEDRRSCSLVWKSIGVVAALWTVYLILSGFKLQGMPRLSEVCFLLLVMAQH